MHFSFLEHRINTIFFFFFFPFSYDKAFAELSNEDIDKNEFKIDGPMTDSADRTIHFITGQRGARKIFCGGFSYICAKTCSKRKYWACAKQRSRNCRARLITNIEETMFLRRSQLHNHPKEKYKMK